MKTILVPIDNDEGREARLQAAFDLARATSGHVGIVQVTPYTAYAVGDGGMGAFSVASLFEAVEAERTQTRTAIEARLANEDIAWDWHTLDGDLVDRLAVLARLADVIVMNSGPFSVAASARMTVTGDVAMAASAPVLVVPPTCHRVDFTGPALVAWDGSNEAGRALRAAMPLLRLSSAVSIVTIEEKNPDLSGRDAAAWLARHGVNAEVIERGDGGHGIEATIRSVVTETAASWMVQGAYGHSRLRQTIFGGVTRGLLGNAPVPMLIAH